MRSRPRANNLLPSVVCQDTIEAIYVSKEKHDRTCDAGRMPRETLEQHMYTYLNQVRESERGSKCFSPYQRQSLRARPRSVLQLPSQRHAALPCARESVQKNYRWPMPQIPAVRLEVFDH